MDSNIAKLQLGVGRGHMHSRESPLVGKGSVRLGIGNKLRDYTHQGGKENGSLGYW